MHPLGRTQFCCGFCEQKRSPPQQPMAALCSQTAFSVPSLTPIGCAKPRGLMLSEVQQR